MLIGTAAFWAIPKSAHHLRVLWLVALSVAAIISYHAVVFFVLLMTLSIGLAFIIAYRKGLIGDKLAAYLKFALFIPLVVFNFYPDESFLTWTPNKLDLSESVIPTLGLSFYSLKLFVSQKYFMRKDIKFELPAYILSAVYLPSFVAGPIDSAQKFVKDQVATDFDLLDLLDGLGRVAVGTVKILVLAPFVSQYLSAFVPIENGTELWAGVTVGSAYVYCILSFVVLFFNFSGYSDIAIGFAKMVRIDLSENFRLPLISHSIQNFWQRWHLSLSKVITEDLFRPIVRRTGRPKLSLFLAFVIIGLWHKISLGYLIWGMSHGAAMAGFLAILGARRKKKKTVELSTLDEMKKIPGIILTISFVSIVSVIANASDNMEIAHIMQALIPLI
jgi:alginate O-acetyltransferase complex protein AlgI